MTPQAEIDLEHHLLYKALLNFNAKQFHKEPEHSVARIATYVNSEYGIPIDTVLREIKRLKTEGYITVEARLPPEDMIKTCVEKERLTHTRTPEERLRRKCIGRIGYIEYPIITEGGIFEYCNRVKNIYRGDREALKVMLKSNPNLWVCKDRGVWEV